MSSRISPAGIGSGTCTAFVGALPGSGTSFTTSQNYQTTRVDETQDATRLPLNDASQVRAPARNFPTGTPLTTLPTNTNTISASQAAYNLAMQQQQQAFAAQSGSFTRVPPVPTGYTAAPVIIGGQPVATGYPGQPLIINPQFPTSSAPTILAQSTASATSSASGTQLGWRDRDITGNQSSRF